MGNSPGWTYSYVPTVAQWNEAFAGKEDELGYSPVNRDGDTMLGRLSTFAAVPERAGFNIQPGLSPSSPVNGDIWATSEKMYAHIGDVTFEITPLVSQFVSVDEEQSFSNAQKAQARSNIGVVIGTDVEAYSPSLNSIAGLTTNTDQFAYTIAANTWAVTILTPFARTILADTNAAAVRTTIGLDSMATQNANSVAITGGTVAGITDLSIADGGTGASTAPTARTNLGLGNVDNTSDASKPISTDTQNALNLKAPLAGPAFTGNPTTTTAPVGDNSFTIANTAHVQSAMIGGAPQIWVDVTGSRLASTSYRNTTGRPIFVSLRVVASPARSAQVSADDVNWITVGVFGTSNTDNVSFIVPPNYYYRINGAVTSISIWSELR